MVNKVNMGLWADGLLSGEFKQTTGALTKVFRDGTRAHCCLGVACEIAIRHGVELDVRVSGKDISGNNYVSYGGRGDALPGSVVAWLGLDTDDPLLAVGTTAIGANDGLKWSFEEIANVLKIMYKLEVAEDGQDDTES